MHAINREPILCAVRGNPSDSLVPEHEAIAARLVRDAIRDGGATFAQVGDATGNGKSKVARWSTGECAPSLLHLVRLSQFRPTVCTAIARGLLALCEPSRHIARPIVDRMMQLTIEIGHTAHEIQAAQADGHVDDEERARIRRELSHVIEVATQAMRDLDSEAR
jgi:hypothetical protein